MKSPKYKVIAPYPDSPFKVGEILELNKIYKSRVKGFIKYIKKYNKVYDEDYFNQYPNIFERIE